MFAFVNSKSRLNNLAKSQEDILGAIGINVCTGSDAVAMTMKNKDRKKLKYKFYTLTGKKIFKTQKKTDNKEETDINQNIHGRISQHVNTFLSPKENAIDTKSPLRKVSPSHSQKDDKIKTSWKNKKHYKSLPDLSKNSIDSINSIYPEEYQRKLAEPTHNGLYDQFFMDSNPTIGRNIWLYGSLKSISDNYFIIARVNEDGHVSCSVFYGDPGNDVQERSIPFSRGYFCLDFTNKFQPRFTSIKQLIIHLAWTNQLQRVSFSWLLEKSFM